MDRTSITGLATQLLESALCGCIASRVLLKGWGRAPKCLLEPVWGCWSRFGVLEFAAVQHRQGQGGFMSCLSPACAAAGQSLPALGPCRVGMEVRRALCLGTRRKPWESLALLPCPPAKPSALLAVSLGAERSCRLAPVHLEEHPATVGPMCQHSQGLGSRSIVPWGSRCLMSWLCRCPARAQILLCLSRDAGGCCCMRSRRPSAALQGRVHGVGRAPHSLPGFGNRPDQFPRALASSTDLTAACQPHAALSFGQELPARLDYRRPKHPLVLCCWPQPLCPAEGTSTRAAPALSKLGKENRSGG